MRAALVSRRDAAEEGIFRKALRRPRAGASAAQNRNAARKAAAEVESRGLSVRQTETLVASLLRQAEQSEKEEKKPPVVDYVREAEKALSDALGRGVKFQGGQKKGRIALEFYSADDREALMEALKHMDKPWKKK